VHFLGTLFEEADLSEIGLDDNRGLCGSRSQVS
jgi:hypothetical protein